MHARSHSPTRLPAFKVRRMSARVASKKQHMAAAVDNTSNLFDLLPHDVLSILIKEHLDESDTYPFALVCRAIHFRVPKPFRTLSTRWCAASREFSGHAFKAVRRTIHVRGGGAGATSGAAVVARSELSVERETCADAARGGHLEVLQWRALRNARGTNTRALMRREAATSRCCSGRALRNAVEHVHMLFGSWRRPPRGAQ